ncbi:Tox-REase-5 domain-containing protein [Myxococcus llanfairpwllgwyngyllgogerychwyrndrobwllllantysiliogogogochensis]|uniref:Tox-REase-5 domain-containing protein n=1 Tax=Myxococcus llanfairpwllgwyngyllgogerychwyrndrobwllllantysiliogogogochensis TaxID=2590453 RepID=UPI001FE42413|nr:Tox-REase-5 domain-containing protein [Myxococcus llanfairpwllgwyngyllgogerychwyrndrobwllllantysiliogogogochensis]
MLEAKGQGYARFFEGLDPKEWFRHSGAKGLVDQARRQSEKVRGLGFSIRWHVAEQQAADAIEKLLMRNRIKGIEVVCTPAL